MNTYEAVEVYEPGKLRVVERPIPESSLPYGVSHQRGGSPKISYQGAKGQTVGRFIRRLAEHRGA